MNPPILRILAYACLGGILIAGFLFAASMISSAALNAAVLALSVGWFSLRLAAASRT